MHMTEQEIKDLRYENAFGPGRATVPVPVPSLATLRRIPWLNKLNNDPEKVARAARRYMRAAALDPSNYSSGRFSGRFKLAAAETVLATLDRLFETHGVEQISRDRDSLTLCATRFMYLNTGDTYTTTIVFYAPTRSWRVTSWGDVVEADERRGVMYR